MIFWTDIHNSQFHLMTDMSFAALPCCRLCCWNDWIYNIMIIWHYACICIMLWCKYYLQGSFLVQYLVSEDDDVMSLSWGGRGVRLVHSRHQSYNQRHSNSEGHYQAVDVNIKRSYIAMFWRFTHFSMQSKAWEPPKVLILNESGVYFSELWSKPVA